VVLAVSVVSSVAVLLLHLFSALRQLLGVLLVLAVKGAMAV
jgi:hypothetical protein